MNRSMWHPLFKGFRQNDVFLMKEKNPYLCLRWDDRSGRTGLSSHTCGMMAVIPQVSWADSGQLGPTWGQPGPRDRSQRRSMPGGRFSGPGDHSGPISGHFRRFRARPPTRDLNIVTLPQLRQDRCLLLRQDKCLLLRQDRCLLLRQD